MRSGTLRINWLWPVVLIGLAALWLVQTLGGLPPAVADWIGRAWPIALLALGLHALIGARVRFASVLIVVVCAIALAGTIAAAYAKQSGQIRQDYTNTVTQAIDPSTTKLTLKVTVLVTAINVTPISGRTVTAAFVGSTESQITSAYKIDQGVGALTIDEHRPNAIPKLDQIGRATLTITLPNEVPIDTLTIQTASGDVTIDTSGLTLSTLNTTTTTGNLAITLPTLPAQAALGGNVSTKSGDLTLRVPAGLTLQLKIGSGVPHYDSANYLLLVSNVLQSAGTTAPQAAFTVSASGSVTVQAAP